MADSPRMLRFRRIATWALRPLSILGPIALVLSAGLIPPARDEDGWATLLGTTAVIAVVLLFVLLALVRTFQAKWLRTNTRTLTAREAGVVALLTFLVAWWCLGLNALAHGPGPDDDFGSLAYVHGMFGAMVTVGVLFRWATQRVPGRATE